MKRKDVSDADYELIQDHKINRISIVAVSVLILFFGALASMVFLSGCSLTMQNINIEDVEASGHLESLFPTKTPIHEAI